MRRFIFLTLGALVLLSLQSCALTLLDLATPTSGYSLQSDIEYGEHKRQRLDIYAPENPKDNAQTLVFFYGGAWDSGSKDDYRFVAQAFAEQGYRVVIPDYRLYPEVKFPIFLEDAATAVQWVSENTKDPIVLIGHSAGAHIAAMLVLNPTFLNNAGFEQTRLQAWVGLSGPYDFLPFTSKTVSNIFSHAQPLELSQPIYFANQKSIPTLLIHGESDTRVLPKNSKNLAKILKSNNTSVTEHYYKDAKHAATVGGISTRLRGQSPSFGHALDFLKNL